MRNVSHNHPSASSAPQPGKSLAHVLERTRRSVRDRSPFSRESRSRSGGHHRQPPKGTSSLAKVEAPSLISGGAWEGNPY